MEEKKFRMSLSRKMAVLVTVFTLALSAALIAMSYFYYRNEMMEDYERFAMNIGAIAASQLNPDKIQGYLESGEADEEYERAYRTLCQIRENGGVEYLYVVKPELEEVWYVLDTDQGQGAIPLGFHEPYYEGAFAENADNMARGERIDPIISNEEYGWLMSVYYPLRTSAGEPAGYVGVDILMNEVKEELHTFAVQMIILMLILSTVFLVVMIVISHRMVTNPIRRLSSAAGAFSSVSAAAGTVSLSSASSAGASAAGSPVPNFSFTRFLVFSPTCSSSSLVSSTISRASWRTSSACCTRSSCRMLSVTSSTMAALSSTITSRCSCTRLFSSSSEALGAFVLSAPRLNAKNRLISHAKNFTLLTLLRLIRRIPSARIILLPSPPIGKCGLYSSPGSGILSASDRKDGAGLWIRGIRSSGAGRPICGAC